MKRIIRLSVTFIILIACQRDYTPGSGSNATDNISEQPITATLQGTITDETGTATVGVVIKTGSQITITDENGYFRIENASLDQNASFVTAEKTGYFTAYRSFSATSGANQVAIKLTKKAAAGKINAVSGGEVSLSNGSKVELKANSIVMAASGLAYSGDVTVYAAYIDPTANDVGETIPGSLMANDKEGKRVMLSSYGMLAVELASDAGEKLQIATGQSAVLTTAIPASLQSSAPTEIPLWYINEQNGLWKEDGTAIKNGTSYVGAVKHFSFWNADIKGETVAFSAKINNADGEPLVNAGLRFTSKGKYSFYTYAFTDSIGQVKLFVPANQPIEMSVVDPCGNVLFSRTTESLTENKNVGTIAVSPGIITVSVKGNLVSCTPQAGKMFAVVSINKMTHYTHADAAGNFASNFVICNNTQGKVTVYGIDETNVTQGPTIAVNTRAPVTDVGKISTCGGSLNEYVKYTIDESNYSILDSLDSYSDYEPATKTTANYLFGKGQSSPDNFHLTFKALGTGTFPIVNCGLRNFGIATSKVTITSYATNPGDYYEGNFSGTVSVNTSVPFKTYPVSVKFKIKRRF